MMMMIIIIIIITIMANDNKLAKNGRYLDQIQHSCGGGGPRSKTEILPNEPAYFHTYRTTSTSLSLKTQKYSLSENPRLE